MTSSVTIIKTFLAIVLLLIVPSLQAKTIVVIGDSISAAYGMHPDQGWVHLLAKRLQKSSLDYKVINDSISGDTTSNGLARLTQSLKRHRPNILMIELGGNDALRGLAIQQIKQNLSLMIQQSQDSDIKVILIAVNIPPNYGPEYNQQFNTLFLQLAKQYQIPLVKDLLVNIGNKSKLMQQDGIHPNARAQQILLDKIWPVLEPML